MAEAHGRAPANASGWETPHAREEARGDVMGRGQRTEGESGRKTLRHIILGLLAAHPMSGYDIKRAFDRSLATYWNAGNSQIYTTLKALAAQGLVSSELIVQENRPNRRLYSLTEAGEIELAAWLSEEVPTRFTKDEFLTKLFFCGHSPDEQALRHLEAHLATLRAQLADMDWALREFGGRASRRPRLLEYQMLVREYKQAALLADQAVTERAIAQVRARLAPDM
jgi:DNA-binding PadR family transcriptional regulator